MSTTGTLEAAPAPAKRTRAEPLGAWLRNPAIICVAIAVTASGAVLITLESHLVFFGDEWNLVFDRRGSSAAAFLDPHNGHLVLGLVVIYKLLLATFGMTSPYPFHVASTIVYLLAAVLLFIYARRRAGDWLALLGTTVILFFGASAVDLLSPFQMFFSGSIAAGIGALLALDRDDRRGDAIACALLVVATTFSEVGIVFSLGALAHVAVSRRPVAGRLYVALVPLILYALWWLGWGHTAQSFLTLRNVATTPSYMLDAVATAIGALLGITSSGDQLPDAVGQQWAPILLVAAVSLAAWRVRRLGGVPRGVWPVLAVGVTFWALAGLSQNKFRTPDNARYLYPSAVFILLIASELMQGVRFGRRAVVAVAAVTAMAVAANLVFLSDSYKLFWKPGSQISQAELRAVEIAGPLNPSFVFTLGLVDINAGSYLSAVDAWGSPAYTESELVGRPAGDRLEADKVLGAILGLKLTPGGSAVRPCRTVQASPSGSTGVVLVPGRVKLTAAPGTKAEVALGRFSDELPVDAGRLGPGSRASLTIPSDRSNFPWRLGLEGDGPVRVCGARLWGGGSQ